MLRNILIRVTFSTCQALGKYCPKLQRLDLSSCSEITDLSLKALADGCRALTHLNIAWCENITQNGKLFHQFCFLLFTFYLCLIITYSSGVEALARGCPKLRSFMCSGCTQVNDAAVSVLAANCPSLEVVNLFGCNVSLFISFLSENN